MSQLIYDIPLEEEFGDITDANYQLKRIDIPHFKEIAAWLPKEWKKCEIHKTFDGILKDKVASCTMRCYQKTENGHTKSVARVTISFIPGFRLSEKKRQACWEQLDGQMADGFGESYDGSEIPGADGWKICF